MAVPGRLGKEEAMAGKFVLKKGSIGKYHLQSGRC
jgi:hypothetical protein